MEEKLDLTHHGDSDSGQSPSGNEKGLKAVPLDDLDRVVPDPDAHLSDEERAKIVCSSSLQVSKRC